MLPRSLALVPLMMLTSIDGAAAGGEADYQADEEMLRAARVQTDGSSLLSLFRKRTPDADSQTRIKTLIGQLGSASFSQRKEASEELATFGVEAVGLLRTATHNADLEIRRRARDVLALLEKNDLPTEILMAALRVLSRAKPEQLDEVLLDYAPYAGDDEIIEELCLALTSTAVLNQKDAGSSDANPLLVQALTDKSPSKKALAAAALCRSGCRKQFPAMRRLLRDPDSQVRRRVALALLEAREKSAVPVLIELLSELPLAEAEHIESMLLQISGESAPKGSLHADRSKYRNAWVEWWKQHGDKLDLAKIDLAPHWRGYTLAICTAFMIRNRGGRSGNLLEFDSQGRVRWQMKGLSYPVDAQVLDERRVLVTEHRLAQVTERNHKGDVLRRISVPDLPLEARRLPNGNTLITTSNRVFEIDRNDKEVWTANGTRSEAIASACSFRGGDVGICYQSGEFIRMDKKGKELASFRVGSLRRPNGMSHIHGLPNGHVLVPLYSDNKVVEFDESGQEVWSASFTRPTCAQRLPNGRTLVAGYGNSFFVELDKNGREVKSQRCEAPLLSVSGR